METDSDEGDALWTSVYSAREAYYRQQFGELPSDILKIGHLFGVWPGGGLFVILATVIGQNVWAYTTFGLSNPDMPPSVTATDVEVERDDQGRTTRSSARLKAKERVPVLGGLAGYGYEIAVLARENAEWPLWFLQWAVNAEILNDAGLLQRVEKNNGLTVEEIKVGEGESVNVLIAKAMPPLPVGTTLPNGKMDIVIATTITDEEMRWSMVNGRSALLERLRTTGVGQFSVRDRASSL